MRVFFKGSGALVAAILSSACGGQGAEWGEPLEEAAEPSICGGSTFAASQFQDVEKYVATGGVAKSFIDARERPVAIGGGCTGTLLGGGLLVTAFHCGIAPGTTFSFNYQVSPSDVVRTTETYTVAEVLEEGQEHPDDYAIARLYHNPENRWGASVIDPRAAVANETLVIIQHPVTSRSPANALKVADIGTVSSVSSQTIVYANLDTDSGTSGSGIIAASSGRIIGVHENGTCGLGTNGIGNDGTPMELIASLSDFLVEDHGSGTLYATAPSSGDGTSLGSAIWDINTWRSSWRHVVSGSFGGTSNTDLFFYDGDAGEGQFQTVSSSGISALGSTITAMRRDWTQIVPLQVDSSGTMTELLFYDWRTGEGKFYSTDGSGSLDLLGSETGWRSTWRSIVAGDFTDDAGSELVFYDPTAGEIKVIEVTSSAQLGDATSNTGFGSNVHSIVAGNFDSDARDEVLVYDPIAGTGKFYRISDSGQMTLIATHTFRSSWSQITTSNSAGSNLVFYDMSAGQGKFYSVSNGAMTEQSNHTSWRRSWGKIVAGNFTSSAGVELLFYDHFKE